MRLEDSCNGLQRQVSGTVLLFALQSLRLHKKWITSPPADDPILPRWLSRKHDIEIFQNGPAWLRISIYAAKKLIDLIPATFINLKIRSVNHGARLDPAHSWQAWYAVQI